MKWWQRSHRFNLCHVCFAPSPNAFCWHLCVSYIDQCHLCLSSRSLFSLGRAGLGRSRCEGCRSRLNSDPCQGLSVAFHASCLTPFELGSAQKLSLWSNFYSLCLSTGHYLEMWLQLVSDQPRPQLETIPHICHTPTPSVVPSQVPQPTCYQIATSSSTRLQLLLKGSSSVFVELSFQISSVPSYLTSQLSSFGGILI